MLEKIMVKLGWVSRKNHFEAINLNMLEFREHRKISAAAYNLRQAIQLYYDQHTDNDYLLDTALGEFDEVYK